MKLRILIVVAVFGLGALVVYVARNTYWDEVTIPAPLRGEALTNPFYAAQKLAESLGATTEWRRTLGTLPETDAVLVLSNWHWDLIEARREQIVRWVLAGGHLVIDRTLIGGDEHIAAWSGIVREYREAYAELSEEQLDEAEAADDDVISIDDELAGDAELCTMLREVDANGMVPASARSLHVCTLDPFSYFATEREIEWGYGNGELQAVRVRVGHGWLTALNSHAFGNRDLTQMDHAEYFVEATALRRGSHIVFLSEHEHTSLLGLIWLHGAPVVVLAMIVLTALLWRGGVRFGPLAAPPETARRSLAEQIRGTGQFTLRLGGGKALHAATVRALQEAASRRIARYASLPHEARIAAIAAATSIDQKMLAAAFDHGGVRRPGELAHTIALLETARRKMLQPAGRAGT